MNLTVRSVFLVVVLISAFSFAPAQEAKPGMLDGDDLKKLVPASYFFHGQSAPVQLRNSAGIRAQDGKLVLAGLVDTSGYSADIQQKYQGFLITEVKLDVGGSSLAPGQYGFGFSKDGKLTVMDVAGNDVINASAGSDDKLQRPVPLKIVQENDGYRLYSGKKWVSLKLR